MTPIYNVKYVTGNRNYLRTAAISIGQDSGFRILCRLYTSARACVYGPLACGMH